MCKDIRKYRIYVRHVNKIACVYQLLLNRTILIPAHATRRVQDQRFSTFGA